MIVWRSLVIRMNRNEQNAQFHDAFILNRRPYRNTSALLDCYSRDYGRLSLIAQGARRSSMRFSAALQPFVPLRVQWRGSRDLKTLSIFIHQNKIANEQRRF